jgi:predicted MFS family arabinose efflux permease
LKDYGLDYRTTYATLAAFSMGGLVGMLFAGCARDLSVKNQLALLSLGRAAAFLCFLLLPLSQVGAFADFFLLGAFLLPVLPLTAVLTDKLIGTRWLATLFGVQSVLYGIGGALGVFLSGSLYDAFKSYHPALWLACVASIVAAAACYFIREAVDTSDTKEAAAPLRA